MTENLCSLLRTLYKDPKDKVSLDRLKYMYGDNPIGNVLDHLNTDCASCIRFFRSRKDRKEKKGIIKGIRLMKAINSLTSDFFEKERIDLILCEGMKKARRGKEQHHD